MVKPEDLLQERLERLEAGGSLEASWRVSRKISPLP